MHRGRAIPAVCWLAGPAVYLLAEAIAAAAFPGYSYAANFISDLGSPGTGLFEGRAINSPLHAVMNVGFIMQGAALVLAAVLTTLRGQAGRIPALILAVIFGVGIALVGTFSAGPASTPEVMRFHVLGAAMAILGGNMLCVWSGFRPVIADAPVAYRRTSAAFGVAGLIAVAMLVIDGNPSVDILPSGVWERASVYTVTIWQLFTGLTLWRRGESA